MQSTRTLEFDRIVEAVTALALPSLASAATPDPFFQYTDSTPLSSVAPGTILKSRTISVYIAGIQTSLKATQLVYRSTDAKQRPTANVTTIFAPDCAKVSCANKNKVLSYQSFYDSLNPEDAPSRAFMVGNRLPDLLPAVETILFGKYVKQGLSHGCDANASFGGNAPGVAELWSAIAQAVKCPGSPFGANPHAIV